MPEELHVRSGTAAEVQFAGRILRIEARPVTSPPPARWPAWLEWPLIGLLTAALWFSQPYIHTALFVVLLFAAVLGGLVLLVSVRMLGPSNFDLVKGEFRHGWPGFRKRRRLADLAAIQLVADEREKLRTSHQVNLVFADDAEEPRVPLSSFATPGYARKFGRHMADMLKVPLVDQLMEEQTEGGHATQSGTTDSA
jgi:hypothetical protein